MNNNARGTNVSPGVYTREVDISYSSPSLGITTLGVAGETLKGPAFEPVLVKDWDEFQDYFGGLSTAKFKASDYPKYELPYIAESYLTASNQLEVCRVLGLSGYNAGPAWIITASKEGSSEKYVVALLRSRGTYQQYTKIDGVDECDLPIYKYDYNDFDVDTITITPYTNLSIALNCGTPTGENADESYDIYSLNHGQFTLNCFKNGVAVASFPVSLNSGTKDYILNVLGNKQDDGDTQIYVEELYDLSLNELINSGKVNQIDNIAIKFNDTPVVSSFDSVLSFVNTPTTLLDNTNLGQRFVADANAVTKFKYEEWQFSTGQRISVESKPMKLGHIYTVRSFINNEKKTEYCYSEYDELIHQEVLSNSGEKVLMLSTDKYYMLNETQTNIVEIVCDLNNYKEQFRCASTPWFVSELKGDAEVLEVKRLFRFHTISDGNAANAQVKVSIANIRPDDGTFDVLVRDYNDSDGNNTILERYTKCSMLPGSANYVGLKIGTTNGDYVTNSKYISIEIIENETTYASVPCGFLGYPMRDFNGVQPDGTNQVNLIQPNLTYNTILSDDIRVKKQYFGMSSIIGVDVDVLNYKGVDAYVNSNSGYSNGFHMDSRINVIQNGQTRKVLVDGMSGYTWDTVSPNNVTNSNKSPIIGNEVDMVGTIYEDINTRKFTAYPYGGFDGWDIYRDYRSNTDEFKATKYNGDNFSSNINGSGLGLSGNIINSDYYAYLAGYRQFSNPQAVLINIFATPGIDYVNNKLLVEDVVDMIEEERGDALYIVTTPDKPFGASDIVDEMYSVEEVASNIEDSDINSSWVATYYPWVKYWDSANNKYINLPVTKDVVRNLAYTDNNGYPWLAPAGMTRGNVVCEKAHYKTTLSDENTLYEYNVNPVKTFATDGVQVWGQKTLYHEDTPLNRINVRRLMIRIKDLVVNTSKYLIFDPNDNTVADQFLSLVNPILTNIKSNRGITDFKIQLDTSDEARDRLELPAKIWIKPTPTLEYIDISFIITPQSVEF